MPCVTASGADVKALQELVERNPRTEIRIDLIEGTCQAGDFRCPISMPPNVRDAFATGAWDTTGLLLDRYEEVNATAARLPYVGVV
jgi:3-isopropylmalate/(R)-2-methylmalate dehydratase small subunit